VNDVCAVTVFRLKVQFRGKKSMAEMYTAVEYIEMIARNAREAARVYRERFPNRCPILESMELILIGKIGKFSHEKCKSVFWTYVRRIVPLVIRRIISPIVYHEKIPGDQKGLFKLAVQLRKFYISVIYNTATGYVLLVYLTNI
jgi:hypothetical protein